MAGAGVHWEGTRLGEFPHDKCDDKVRGVQRFHMDDRGWADIAYSFMFCAHDHVYEGRGWYTRTAANGTNDANSRYLAFCYLGGEGDPYTDGGKRALAWLKSELVRIHKVDVLRPHSAFKPTACPGDAIRAHVAAGAPAPANPTPPPPKMRVSVTVDMPVLARGSQGQHVQKLQGIINTLDPKAALVMDGDFGPATQDAVRRLQHFFGEPLKDGEGIVGTVTWRTLLALPL